MTNFNIVDFAHQIIELDNRNRVLEAEVERLNDIDTKYEQLLRSSIEHANSMSELRLDLLLNGGKFSEASIQETRET